MGGRSSSAMSTMADYFLLLTLFAFSLAPEGKQILPKFPRIVAWDNRMDALPSVLAFNRSSRRASRSNTPARGASSSSGGLTPPRERAGMSRLPVSRLGGQDLRLHEKT